MTYIATCCQKNNANGEELTSGNTPNADCKIYPALTKKNAFK